MSTIFPSLSVLSLRRISSVGAVFAVALALATTAHAYEYPSIERGFKPERAFQIGDVDHINLFNGSLSLTIPIGQRYPVGLGSELTYGLTLSYSSQVWDYIGVSIPQPYPNPPKQGSQAWPARTSNAGLGWRLSLGEYQDSFIVGPGRCTPAPCYIGPDGGQHSFYPDLYSDKPDNNADLLYTRDGTLLRLRVAAREIEFPDGQIHKFDTSGRLVQIRDRFSNYVNVTYATGSWTLTDSHGRTQTVNLVTVPYYGKAVGSVVVRAFGGTQATYTFNYTTYSLPRSCVDDDPQTSATISVPLLTGVTLPDGSAYSMPVSSYHTAANSAPCGSQHTPALQGLLLSLGLPTRGSIQWGYTAYEFPVAVEGEDPYMGMWLAKNTGVSVRYLKDGSGGDLGTWKYNHSLPFGQNAQESVTQVTSPLGDRTDHYFRVGHNIEELYGLPFSPLETAPGRADLFRSTKVYDCAADGTSCVLKRTTYLKYRVDTAFPSYQESNARVESSYVRHHDDADRWQVVDRSSYDGLGHYRTQTLSGNYGSGDAQTTTTNYNPMRGTYPGTTFVMPTASDPWVLATYDYRTVTAGSTTYRQDACFDTATGFLTRTRARKSTTGTIGTADLVTTITRDAAASKITERAYGGDLTTVGTSAALCTLTLGTDAYRIDNTYQYGSLKTSQFSGTTGTTFLKTVDRTIDLNTGLAASDKDTAGVATSFDYDAMGRITAAKPAEDAWVRYIYTSPAAGPIRIITRTSPNGTLTGSLTDHEVTLDDLGRAVTERRRMPGGWARRSTLYDGMSRVTDVSEWQADAANTRWTRFRSFDAFGRPGYIDPPEGSTHRVSFAYTGDRVVARTSKVGTSLSAGAVVEANVTVTERYDRQGRLYQVVDGAGTATYAYDPTGKLTNVTMPGQTRLFTFDGRGFLTSEKHPEKGASGNGTVTYSRYDARGNVGSKSDGPMSVDYVYDRAGRLLRVEEPGTGNDLKVFTYGTGTTASDRSAGKVKVADRYNYVVLGTTPYTVQVRETYTYAGRSGRPSKRESQVWVNGVAGSEHFRVSVGGYDELGNRTSLTYPECLQAACAGLSPRTVTFNYNNAMLNAVPGWATSISYHWNGALASVAHYNGVTDNHTADPWSRPRPRAISTTGALSSTGTAQEWATGTYTYDGSGNIIHQGVNRYVYDTLSRLKSADITTGQAGGAGPLDRFQSYVYDTAGNITSTTTGNTGTAGTSVATATALSTNRLTSAVYDAAGSLTSWNGNSYTYDRFGMMWRFKSGAIDDLYLYNAEDERVWIYPNLGTTGPQRWTLRDFDGKVLREWQNAANVWTATSDYIYRGSQLLATATPAGNRHFHLDHLGTPRLITADNRRRVAFHTYYPFGQEATSPTQDTEGMKFTGHERDLNATTGSSPTADDLDYMHSRHYSPLLNRFLMTDTSPQLPRTSQEWNRYTYVFNAPLIHIDPFGLDAVDLCYTGDKGYEVSCTGTITVTPQVADRGPGVDSFIASHLPFNTYLPMEKLSSRADATQAANTTRRMSFEERVIALVAAGEGGECRDPNCQMLEAISQSWHRSAMLDAIWATPAATSILLGGQPVAGAARPAVGLVTRKLFGKGALLNSNQYLRVGYARLGGTRVFRIGGSLVERFVESGKIDLWIGGPL